MNFKGRWITRNGTLVACHLNLDAKEGDRETRWKGHTIPTESGVRLNFMWNENGECVLVDGAIDKSMNPNPTWGDLMERVTGKDRAENSLKVEGCKECEG